jgi:predicted MPP superfamily phosphohydrolase
LVVWLQSAPPAMAYASLVERNLFTLRRFDVPVLPADARPVRVLQLSDLHLVPRQQRKIEWVRGLDALEPDLVVNTGDNFAAMDAAPSLVRAMEPLMERPGVFVMGSNDYWERRASRTRPVYLTDRLREGTQGCRRDAARPRNCVSGVRRPQVGSTSTTRVTTIEPWAPRGSRVELVGVDDPHIERDRYAEVEGPASSDAELLVGLAHAPYQRVLDAMTADGAGLVIAGHTHGGQLALPVFGALVTNCDMDRRRAKGLSRWWPGAGSPGQPRAGSGDEPDHAAYLHVSAGLGTSPYAPVRFACRPEATLLTLTARP